MAAAGVLPESGSGQLAEIRRSSGVAGVVPDSGFNQFAGVPELPESPLLEGGLRHQLRHTEQEEENLITRARTDLGRRWLGRPLRKAELARLVGLSDANGAEHIARLEKGTATLSGPVEVAVRMMLAGATPPTFDPALRPRYRPRPRPAREGAGRRR